MLQSDPQMNPKIMKWEELLSTERARPTTSSGDHRAQFERDFDRAIFSTPIKRLQDKAQVFPLEPHDAVRTRLTHSLEVSSVAKGLGIAISGWLLSRGEIKPGQDRQIEAIAATCGLIHDLGNPPFGHAGEDAIREWFMSLPERPQLLNEFLGEEQLETDFSKFEGNAQTLRIVSKLQVLADFNGLNLTFGTLSAAIKYVSPSHEADESDGNHARTKVGYFASENDLVARIRAATNTGQSRNPITFLVEAADDIVYSVTDIEDGIKKAILLWRDFEEEFKTSCDSGKVKSIVCVLSAPCFARKCAPRLPHVNLPEILP
jgi:dGTPase